MIKATIKGYTLLENLNKEQMNKIKEELTFDNPAYLDAIKFGGGGFTKLPKYVHYYEQYEDKLLIPRGYDIPYEYEVINDLRVKNNVNYPVSKIALRDTQKEALNAFYEHNKGYDENGIIILPTGKGKSVLGLVIAQMMKQRVLIIVPKTDILNGWVSEFCELYNVLPKEVGTIKNGKIVLGEYITVITVQTLINMKDSDLKILHDYFGMIIVDEFHRSVARMYDKINHFPATYKIGLTATLLRNDGLRNALFLHFGYVCYKYDYVEDDTDILPVQVKVREYTNKLVIPNEVKEVRGELVYRPPNYFNTLKILMEQEDYINMVVNDIVREAKINKKSCIVFVHQVDHLNLLRSKLRRNNVIAQVYTSGVDSNEMVRKAESKEVLVTLATYAIATEGTNVKAWERGFMVTSLNNEKNVIQAIGRVRRTKEGKKDCIIYDYQHIHTTILSKHAYNRTKIYHKLGFKVVN